MQKASFSPFYINPCHSVRSKRCKEKFAREDLMKKNLSKITANYQKSSIFGQNSYKCPLPLSGDLN